MKNLLIIFAFIFSVLYSGTVIGQNNDVDKTVFNKAIEMINENTELSAKEKKKFVSRLEFIAKNKTEIQEKEYNRIVENYKKTTGLELPKFNLPKK